MLRFARRAALVGESRREARGLRRDDAGPARARSPGARR